MAANILQEGDTEFMVPLTLATILDFSPGKFVKWAAWRTGTLPKALDEAQAACKTAGEMLEKSPNLAEKFQQCVDDYKKISEVFAAYPEEINWPHLPFETVQYKMFQAKYKTQSPFTPSAKVLAWFLGAVLVYNVDDPKIYYTTKGITRALPGITPGRFDLTLVPGDLGDETVDSKIVSDVMEQHSKRKASLHYLIGVSGAGKTKALFDIGRKKLSLYFDFAVEEKFKSAVTTISNSYANNDDHVMIEQIEYEIDFLIATRLVLLMIMKFKNPAITIEQMLLSQLSVNYQDRHSMVERIRIVLRAIFNTSAKLELVLKTAYHFLGVDSKSLVILCDEAQTLLKIAEGKFKSTKAGTSLALVYFDQLESITGKALGEIVFKQKHANFKYITEPEDCRRVLEHLFDVKLTGPNISDILAKLQGRARWLYLLPVIADLQQYQKHTSGLSNEEILMLMVDNLFSALTSFNSTILSNRIGADAIPATSINNDFDKIANLYADLVALYYFAEDRKEDPVVPEGANFFANGLVGVVCPEGEDTRYEITEPLIVAAIRNTFKRKGLSIAAAYMGGNQSRVEQAVLLELSCQNIAYSALGIPSLANEIGVFAPKNLLYNKNIIDYLNMADSGNFIIHPNDKEHPDICYFNDGVLWLFSCKTTKRYNRGVDLREVTDGYNSTDIHKYSYVKTTERPTSKTLELEDFTINVLKMKFNVVKQLKKNELVAYIKKNFSLEQINQALHDAGPVTNQQNQEKAAKMASEAAERFMALLETLATNGQLKRVVRLHMIFPRATGNAALPEDGLWKLGEKMIPYSSLDVTCGPTLTEFCLFSSKFKARLSALFPAEKEDKKRRRVEGNRTAKPNKKHKASIEEESIKDEVMDLP